MYTDFVALIVVNRIEKEKQQLIVEVEGFTMQIDEAKKAQVRVCYIRIKSWCFPSSRSSHLEQSASRHYINTVATDLSSKTEN